MKLFLKEKKIVCKNKENPFKDVIEFSNCENPMHVAFQI